MNIEIPFDIINDLISSQYKEMNIRNNVNNREDKLYLILGNNKITLIIRDHDNKVISEFSIEYTSGE